MLNKKQLKKFGLVVCLFTCLSFGSFAYAEDTDNSFTFDKVKETIEKGLPQKLIELKDWVFPYAGNAVTNIENWMGENMPAAKKEFVDEVQALPKELWDSGVSAYNWLSNFFKK